MRSWDHYLPTWYVVLSFQTRCWHWCCLDSRCSSQIVYEVYHSFRISAFWVPISSSATISWVMIPADLTQLQHRSETKPLDKDPMGLSRGDAKIVQCCCEYTPNSYVFGAWYLLKLTRLMCLIRSSLILLIFYQWTSLDCSLSLLCLKIVCWQD